jgi:tripartite-type tricarboxylate transporter receptor subunit TctC
MVLCTGAIDARAASSGAEPNYPNKPIRLVTGLAGGAADVLARLTVQGISGPLGQTVVVDNRGGGLIPGEIVSKTPADGYTLLVTGGNLWITALLQKAPYDAMKDFLPITVLVRTVTVLVVHPSVAASSVKELIALAKAKPGQLNYGSGATGGAGHLAGELLKSMAGVNIVHVPYKGNAPQVTGLITGEVHMVIGDVSLVMPHVKSGKLRALAVTSAEPSAMVPGLPTVAASGVPGYESGAIYGMWAPAKTPRAIIQRLNQEVVRYLRKPEAKEKFFNAGAEIVANSPEEFAAIIKSDIAKWGKLIKDVGIKGG